MKLSKNGFIISCSPNPIILTETKIKIIKLIFDVENWLWKSNFGDFWYLMITKITSWLKFMGKNLHLVGCATVCEKVKWQSGSMKWNCRGLTLIISFLNVDCVYLLFVQRTLKLHLFCLTIGNTFLNCFGLIVSILYSTV